MQSNRTTTPQTPDPEVLDTINDHTDLVSSPYLAPPPPNTPTLGSHGSTAPDLSPDSDNDVHHNYSDDDDNNNSRSRSSTAEAFKTFKNLIAGSTILPDESVRYSSDEDEMQIVAPENNSPVNQNSNNDSNDDTSGDEMSCDEPPRDMLRSPRSSS